ncbi:MAG: cyclic pyranopterin monophosphate synthase MoaC [Myxococcales bacterium]|nr:cyclic pyranopterin monophosphate synthase MoaC [Myxococcales bacterium]
MKPDDETRLAAPPPGLADRIGERWAELTPLARFAIAHAVKRGDAARLDRTLAELIPDLAEKRLTHLDDEGQARMVDVGQKAITRRMARAGARVRLSRETAQLLVAGQAKKGDVLAVARVAGIMAAKATPSLIPLCHGIALHRVEVTFDVDVEAGVVGVSAVAEANDRTGVEMEAMVAASLAALTIYDMLKAVQRDIAIEEVVLEEKSGGRSGHYRRGATP